MLSVKSLNGDSSFLLTFRPNPDILSYQESHTLGTTTVLIDPWLAGPSTVLHPRFSKTLPKGTPCVEDLRNIPAPDYCLISQDKTDHCHKATLTSLPANSSTRIVAAPKAHKAIKKWRHFEPAKLLRLMEWDARKWSADEKQARQNKDRSLNSPCLSYLRLEIPPLSKCGNPGEITFSYVSKKGDLTGLHNAIGITYKAPTADLTSDYHSQTSPASCDVSVIYSPHGVSHKSLQPLMSTLFVSRSALPVTCLLHSFDRVSNPWYLGGNITSGLPGGKEIVAGAGARYWLSTHDGEKLISGFANLRLKFERFRQHDIESALKPYSSSVSTMLVEDLHLSTTVVVLTIGGEVDILGNHSITRLDRSSRADSKETTQAVNLSSEYELVSPAEIKEYQLELKPMGDNFLLNDYIASPTATLVGDSMEAKLSLKIEEMTISPCYFEHA